MKRESPVCGCRGTIFLDISVSDLDVSAFFLPPEHRRRVLIRQTYERLRRLWDISLHVSTSVIALSAPALARSNKYSRIGSYHVHLGDPTPSRRLNPSLHRAIDLGNPRAIATEMIEQIRSLYVWHSRPYKRGMGA